MKTKIISICLLFFVAACNEEEGPEMGCWTGIPKSGGTERVLISCCEKKTYAAGNNEEAGGIGYSINYTDWKWEPAKNCKECEDKWW